MFGQRDSRCPGPKKVRWSVNRCQISVSLNGKVLGTEEIANLVDAVEIAEAIIEKFHDTVVSVRNALGERLFWYEETNCNGQRFISKEGENGDV